MLLNGCCEISSSITAVSPISDPARIAVRALPIDPVAEMTVFTWWTLVFAVLPEKAWRTHLVTLGAIPASLTGDATSLRDLTWLLTFTVTTPGGKRVQGSHYRFVKTQNIKWMGPI